jgi:methyltransferase (TIGR00027 family)
MKPDRASATARVIAAATVMLASEPRSADPSTPHGTGLVAPQAAAWCRLLLSTTAADRALCASARWAPTRALWRWVERATLPGITLHYAHRKAWIEARCRAAIAEGAARVIVVGAGFDTLALRLASEFPAVEWIEVDHPATQGVKRRALESIDSIEPERRPPVEFIAADLGREPLPASLADSPHSTFVVMEGLLMYLEAARVEALFGQLRRASRSSVRVVFSFIERGADGTAGFRPHSRLIDAWLASRREPFVWAAEPATLQPWLAELGFQLVAFEQPPFGGAWRGRTRLQGESLVEAVAREPAP